MLQIDFQLPTEKQFLMYKQKKMIPSTFQIIFRKRDAEFIM